MQGLNLLVQMGQTLLNGFGLMSMLQAFVGAILFLAVVGFAWERLTGKK